MEIKYYTSLKHSSTLGPPPQKRNQVIQNSLFGRTVRMEWISEVFFFKIIPSDRRKERTSLVNQHDSNSHRWPGLLTLNHNPSGKSFSHLHQVWMFLKRFPHSRNALCLFLTVLAAFFSASLSSSQLPSVLLVGSVVTSKLTQLLPAALSSPESRRK